MSKRKIYVILGRTKNARNLLCGNLGINAKIYDTDIFYAMAHGYFDGFLLKNRIEPLLESKNSGKTGNEIYYRNIYDVMQWMDKKIKKRKLR